MTDLIPQINGGNGNRIFKPELLNAINAMNIKMDPEEYDKLWKKYIKRLTFFDNYIKRIFNKQI
jgi:hypothetical protein